MLRRTWRTGDRVRLDLPMPVERMAARPEVRSDGGKIALQRGPLVYCLEERDHGPDLAALSLPRTAKLDAQWVGNFLGRGAVVIRARALRDDARAWKDELYRPAPAAKRTVRLTAVPYALWNHRGRGEMTVWIREA